VKTLDAWLIKSVSQALATSVMPGTTFEADELYQNAGEKKYAASRSRCSATSPRP
jgi:hypothetical protein